MDKNELMKIKTGLGILAVGVVIFILAIAKTVPTVQKISSTNTEIKTQQSTLEDSKRQLEELKIAEKKAEEEANEILKAFFTPEEDGLDGEAAMALEFDEIMTSMRQHKIKTRSVKYDYDPADDNFVKNVGAKYHACRIDIEMISSYRGLEAFLRDLYKHPHFLELSKIEIVPYKKNKRILLTNLQLKLYTQKSAEEQAAYVPPAKEQPAAEGGAAPEGAAPEGGASDNSAEQSSEDM